LSKEIRRLRAEVSQVRDHLPAIERVARDELGLLRKTEVVFQFDP
jgi:cell division protein FtsB